MPKHRLPALITLALLTLSLPQPTSADIYQWEWIDPADHSQGRQQSIALAPDGAGVDAVPNAQLNFLDLNQAWLHSTDLQDALFWYSTFDKTDFSESNLTTASFWNTTVTNSNFSQADLYGVDFLLTSLDGSNFTGANIRSVHFNRTTGFTSGNLYSTKSYQTGDLYGLGISHSDLAGWNFAGKQMRFASFTSSSLVNADFRNAYLRQAGFQNADLTGVNFHEANLESTTENGLTAAQFYSTATYQLDELPGINLGGNDLSAWNFSGVNLTGSNFYRSKLGSTDFSGAEIRGASFHWTTETGFTPEQLYSTLSYQVGDLVEVDLSGANDLTGWNFAGQNLTNASFSNSTLNSAVFADAIITGASFQQAKGFVSAQLYSTASYQTGNLEGVNLRHIDISGWDFTNQDITNADFQGATLTDVNFTGARIQGVDFKTSLDVGLTATQLYSTASYQEGNLEGLQMWDQDLTNWNLTNQNLTNIELRRAILSGADFSGAIIQGANLSITTDKGLSAAQIYSTASYQVQDLSRIGFSQNDLSGWNFSGQKLSNVDFTGASLLDADLSYANLTHVYFYGASVIGVNFTGADTRGSVRLSLSEIFHQTQNTIHPDGTLYGLNITPAEIMRLWDYDPETPLPIHVTDTLQIDPNGTLKIVLEDNLWGSTLTFDPGIPVNLDGTLELMLDLDDGVAQASLVGTTFNLFDWTGVTPIGQFAQILTEEKLSWDTTNLYTTGQVTLTSVPEPTTITLLLIALAVLPRRQFYT